MKSSHMGRGKTEIKKIENLTNRQVTYSKRRHGLFKKAHELTVLCDAKVSIILVSRGSKRPHEYYSPCSSHKEILDQYQQVLGVDLWNNCYKKMENDFNMLLKANERLNKTIRQRMGEELGELTLKELCGLEQNMQKAVAEIRELKIKKMINEGSKIKKKINHLAERNQKLKQEIMLLEHINMQEKFRKYGFMENNGEANHRAAFKLASQSASQIFALHGQPCQPNPNDHSYRIHDHFHLET